MKLKEVAAPIAKNSVGEVFKAAIAETLDRISRSIDDVSVQLDGLFKKAVKESDEDLNKARVRKERGNPPGKQKDVLGDQISWEQILRRYKVNPKVWLIIKDIDFFMQHDKKCLLNPLLFRELQAISDPPQYFCFDDLDRGLDDFARQSGVPATRLPKGEEAVKIQSEWAAASTAVSIASSSADRPTHFLRTIPGAYVMYSAGPQSVVWQPVQESSPPQQSSPPLEFILPHDKEKPPKKPE